MDIERQMVSVERLLKMLEVPQEKLAGIKPSDLAWPTAGHITFEDVRLKYRPETEVILNGLSFEVKAGEKIGVVGRTGAGKSTIAISLSRIVELLSGKIMIDGHDISKLDLSYLRSRITVIPQDPTIFTGTLRFNLDPEGKATDDRIIDLLKLAQL